MRLLFDHNVPAPLRRYLAHEVVLADEMGWGTLTNGLLLAAAEQQGFDVFITADKNIRHQQNLAGRAIGIVALPTNHWQQLLEHVSEIATAIDRATRGRYDAIDLPRRPLVHKPAPKRD